MVGRRVDVIAEPLEKLGNVLTSRRSCYHICTMSIIHEVSIVINYDLLEVELIFSSNNIWETLATTLLVIRFSYCYYTDSC